MQPRQREAVLHVVEDGAVNSLADPLRHIAVELLRQVQIRQPAICGVEQVHILHGLVDHIVVFRLQLRATVRKQELHERIQELDIALGRLQGKRVHSRAIFANSINLAAVQLDNAFIAPADVEYVSESAIFLLQGDDLISVDRLPGACRADDEHDPYAIHIHVLKEWRPRARLEDVQILGIEIFRMRVSDMRREHRGETSMMVFSQPQRKDVELVIAGEHGVEGGEIAKRLLHHLSPGIDEDPMHSGDGVS